MSDTSVIQMRKHLLSNLLRSLQDRPIEQGDPRYYPFHEAAGEPRGRDPIRELRSAIEMMNAEGTCQLFSGFRGAGKSTELRRLDGELRQLGFHVLRVQGASYINLSQPLELGDLLVSVATGVAEGVLGQAQKSPARDALDKKLKQLFKDLDFDMELNAGIAKFKLKLSRDPSFKLRVQDALRNRLSDFQRQCADFMQDASVLLGAVDGGPCPVLIVDDIEKVHGSLSNADLVQRSIEEIFSQYSWGLRFKGWHCIWTVPPYLQLLNSSIPADFDGCAVLPMVRLWRNDPGRTPDPDGMAAMLGCLRRRGDIDGLFSSSELLERVILSSSGHLRDLLRLLRDLVIEANIPDQLPESLSEKTVSRVLDDYEQGYRQAIRDEDLPWLRRVAETRELTVPDDSMVQRAAKLLDNYTVMTYRNGRQWFDVNAALREKL